MAPDRGNAPYADDDAGSINDDTAALTHETSRSVAQEPIGQEPDAAFLAKRSEQPPVSYTHLTLPTKRIV